MAELVVRNLTRRFPSGGGISDISLSVPSGKFLVLLGPSGCGKSTLLRIIAGLEKPDRGEIELDGVSQLSNQTQRSAIAMVFQNFALYPHMTAFQNIAFPLRLRGTERGEIDRRVRDAASKAGLALDLKRFPRELSGGERQRVALARALVREPQLVLMDEALSSLDPQLRSSLRVELKETQRRTGRTFVYVTHDQIEALALADILAVMREGTIEQIGSPEEVFNLPATQFVARFIGSPPMNLFRAQVQPGGGLVVEGDMRIEVAIPEGMPTELLLGIRPNDLRLAPAAGLIGINVTVEAIEYSGTSFITRLKLCSQTLTAEFSERREPGTSQEIFFSTDRLHFFDAASGKRIDVKSMTHLTA